MALPPLVDVTTFGEWLGLTLSGADETRAEAVLAAVSSLVRAETNLTWVDESEVLETVPDSVHTVVLRVARRVFNNPDSVVQKANGDASVRYADAEAIGLYLNDEDRRLLGRLRAQPRGLWSMSTTRDDPDSDTAYVPVVGGPPFPWYGSDVEV